MSQASALRTSRSPWPWDGGMCTCAPPGTPVPPAMGPAGLSCCLGEPLLDSAVLSLWALLCFPGVNTAPLATSAYLNPQLCPPAAQGVPSDWGPAGCDAAGGEGCSGPSAGASAQLVAFAHPPPPTGDSPLICLFSSVGKVLLLAHLSAFLTCLGQEGESSSPPSWWLETCIRPTQGG